MKKKFIQQNPVLMNVQSNAKELLNMSLNRNTPYYLNNIKNENIICNNNINNSEYSISKCKKNKNSTF